ncbi:hypothetical protein BDR07DRAFT_1381831 [Suillus spraguei]|nr:hypothetical protein BDR07DRAFT_1381831 [Suillus spraguei]
MTVKMQIDIARYSKLISPKNTGHNEEKEEKLLERCPPGHEGTKLVDKPATIIDASGTIITWYLPDALTETTQVRCVDCYSMDIEYQMVPTEGNQGGHQFAGSKPRKKWLGKCWVNSQMHQFISGMVSIGPRDPEVSASSKGPSSENILKAIARLAAITSAALRVMHPQQYFAGLRALSHLGDKALSKELPQMPETLQYWASVFNTLSIISNRETPNHQDHLLIPECFDILTTMGNYSNARMSMPSLQLEFRIVRHGVDGVEGDQIAWAWYMRDSVHIYARVPSCGWARVEGRILTTDSILEIRDSMIDSPNSGLTLGTQQSVRQHNVRQQTLIHTFSRHSGLGTHNNVKDMNSHIPELGTPGTWNSALGTQNNVKYMLNPEPWQLELRTQDSQHCE